ncbi:uncharacterized protein N7479_007285 [Penicillium vulpinum]|uniref:uncharacterized protein n=1 Tax=Penicillium vulpinum TaxID=29845 RepID=UPI0025474015|nr:uncharacterized protein N7479_007285 [Penicillium vulpinum]KAJ5960135.1 hypothetical protein N7479_007285 [Penicillium vulpinum]
MDSSTSSSPDTSGLDHPIPHQAGTTEADKSPYTAGTLLDPEYIFQYLPSSKQQLVLVKLLTEPGMTQFIYNNLDLPLKNYCPLHY